MLVSVCPGLWYSHLGFVQGGVCWDHQNHIFSFTPSRQKADRLNAAQGFWCPTPNEDARLLTISTSLVFRAAARVPSHRAFSTPRLRSKALTASTADKRAAIRRTALSDPQPRPVMLLQHNKVVPLLDSACNNMCPRWRAPGSSPFDSLRSAMPKIALKAMPL